MHCVHAVLISHFRMCLYIIADNAACACTYVDNTV